MEYYSSKIQIDKNVIDDVFANIRPDTKMLVFGLGYDSKMWYEGTNKNTYFVEDKEQYIQLNINDIPLSNIVKYEYKTTCKDSMGLADSELKTFTIPSSLLELAPFDIIIVDGPEGWSSDKPGRLIPCYWASLLSKKGGLVYVDDSCRAVENYCIQKFFESNTKKVFPERSGCTKLFV
jgi:hypothetical protein